MNHNSYLDPFAYAHFQYNTGRVPRFLAKAALFKKGFVGACMRGTGQIPVYRETTDALSAFRAAVDAVERGECVAFYPEGTLTRDPDQWPMTGKTGAARVALLTKCPVIPVAQWGANELLPPYAKKPSLFPRKTHHVLAGPPVDLDAVLRPGVDPRGAAGGDRGHHGRGHPPAGGDPRREGARARARTIHAQGPRRQRPQGRRGEGTQVSTPVKAAVFGTGSWGTAFAMVLADAGCEVTLWGRRPEVAEAINTTRTNPDYLPGVELPDSRPRHHRPRRGRRAAPSSPSSPCPPRPCAATSPTGRRCSRPTPSWSP